MHPEAYFANVVQTQDDDDDYSLLDECDELNQGFIGSQALFAPLDTNEDEWDNLTRFDFNEADEPVNLVQAQGPTKFVQRQINFDHEIQNYLNFEMSEFKKCK